MDDDDASQAKSKVKSIIIQSAANNLLLRLARLSFFFYCSWFAIDSDSFAKFLSPHVSLNLRFLVQHA